MTNEEEKYVIAKFRNMYEHFPEGTLDHPNSPDFILTTEYKKIGIELTQMLHSNKAKQLNSEENDFTNLVVLKLSKLLPFHFGLTIDINENVGISKSKKEKIADDISEVCFQEFKDLPDYSSTHIYNLDFELDDSLQDLKKQLFLQGYRKLPIEVEYIRISRCDAHGNSFNSESNAAWIPRFTKDRLREILDKKNSKISRYIKCDEYWLLIWQSGSLIGEFKEIDFPTPVESKFDRVFVLREHQKDYVILK
jgi:hypothetical protein